ncbi:cell wall-binding repeat-containing protein [Paenisporosarcina sp. TG20]|uniref:cell wall-binding repeat-containing protein n=1 Tax=Paenisporosarcina sp. TG20 TaxID=1211706 RepID=UPI000308F437|nr:cell wall-binding repeat-containing protein [Paenisporosarcina sp. TG20]
MNKKFVTALTAATLAASMFTVSAPVTVKAAGDFSLTVLHSNDTHANLDNIAKKVTLVNELRAANPNNLLLDAGDVFSGTLYFNEFQGAADLEFMNMMKYDAMTFGNHEFDLGGSEEGHKALAEFVTNADFPLISANTDFSADQLFAGLQSPGYGGNTESGQIFDGIIKEVDGEKIGIFGLTTAETEFISSPNSVAFSNYIDEANAAVEYFEGQGVNKIIALTHLGFDDAYDNDLSLAEAVPEIDVIVGGHTHSKMENGHLVERDGADTIIVQANEYNKFLGELDVTFNDAGEITSQTAQLHTVADAVSDETAAAALKPYADQIEELKNKSTGVSTTVVLDGARANVRTGETNLGNLMTDGMLAAAKNIDSDTVIAVQNGGGIRDSIDVGEITFGEVLTVMPFGNNLAIMELSGYDIYEALEHSVSQSPKASGAFLHVSGLVFNFDNTQVAGSRVLTAFVEDEEGNLTELDPDATYKVATNSFTAKGGDGYSMFEAAYDAGKVSEPGNPDWDTFINHIKGLETVDAGLEGRINQVRIAGDDRYKTAIEVSKAGFSSAKTVVIARGDEFADSMTAGPLAYKLNSPILLTRTDSLPESVIEELKRLGTEKVIVMGGTEAISSKVVNSLYDLGISVRRISGEDRYETAAKVATELDATTEAIVVSGLNFPDALSIGSYASQSETPILLTRADRIPAATTAALANVETTFVIGGKKVVSEAVANELPTATRVAGENRFETSVAVAEAFHADAWASFVSSGTGFADALTGSALAAQHGAPMILVRPENVPTEVSEYLFENPFLTYFVIGGQAAVSDDTLFSLYYE